MNDNFLYINSEAKLVGWIRKDLEDLFAEFIRDPDRLLKDSSSLILKNGAKVQVAKQTLRGRGNTTRDVVTKRFHYPSFIRRLGFLFLSSPAARSLQGAFVLKGNDIDTAIPLAALEHRSWYNLGTSYFVAEEVVGSQSLHAFWRDVLPTLSSKKRAETKREILKEVASLFHRLHSRGIYHRDLKGGNILIQEWEAGKWKSSLIDVDGVRKSHRLSWSKRVKNLVQLYRTLGKQLSIRDRVFFLRHYAALCSLSRRDHKALARKVLAMGRKEELRSLQKRRGWKFR